MNRWGMLYESIATLAMLVGCLLMMISAFVALVQLFIVLADYVAVNPIRGYAYIFAAGAGIAGVGVWLNNR